MIQVNSWNFLLALCPEIPIVDFYWKVTPSPSTNWGTEFQMYLQLLFVIIIFFFLFYWFHNWIFRCIKLYQYYLFYLKIVVKTSISTFFTDTYFCNFQMNMWYNIIMIFWGFIFTWISPAVKITKIQKHCQF